MDCRRAVIGYALTAFAIWAAIAARVPSGLTFVAAWRSRAASALVAAAAERQRARGMLPDVDSRAGSRRCSSCCC